MLVESCPNSSYTVAQFGRSTSAATVPIFALRAKSNLKNMVAVQGGTLPQGSSLAGQSVGTFEIGKFEVTWGEWKTVRAWAAANGYDIGATGGGVADNYPVTEIQWYDVVKWCNAKSEMEGLSPVYSYNGGVLRTGGLQLLGSDASDNITFDTQKNGYRLPTIKEWEWAARGGKSSMGYTYSGSNDINAVAWYSANAGGATHPVGTKLPNEIGIFDMSGNTMEWCWDRVGIGRYARGGTWNNSVGQWLGNNQVGNWLPSVGNFWDNQGDFGFRLARNPQ
jgi:formylglycine-generating enzyme required for sulfatase activity